MDTNVKHMLKISNPTLVRKISLYVWLSFIGVYGGWLFNIIFLVRNIFSADVTFFAAIGIFVGGWLVIWLTIRLIVQPVALKIQSEFRKEFGITY